MFWFLDLHQSMWVVKWKKKDEKILKHSISNLCDVISILKFIFKKTYHISLSIYQDNIKKKSKYEITFYFKAS